MTNVFNFGRFFSTRKYTKDHEWITVDGSEGTVGITDYAQNALGDVVYVELPEVGRKIKRKETVVAVESVKAASDVYSPIGGTVTSINETLTKDPSLVNKSPMDQAWMFKLKISDPSEINDLLDENQYNSHCEAEKAH